MGSLVKWCSILGRHQRIVNILVVVSELGGRWYWRKYPISVLG